METETNRQHGLGLEEDENHRPPMVAFMRYGRGAGHANCGNTDTKAYSAAQMDTTAMAAGRAEKKEWKPGEYTAIENTRPRREDTKTVEKTKRHTK